MLTGVARSDDGNPLAGLNPACDYLIIIQAHSSTYKTIADYFQGGGCETLYNYFTVETCTSEAACDDNKKESTLGNIAAAISAAIPQTLFVCADCTPDAEDLIEIIVPHIVHAINNVMDEPDLARYRYYYGHLSKPYIYLAHASVRQNF